MKPELVTEAVADAVDAAVEASEVTNQPTVVEAVVDGATPMDATATETVATKPETDSVANTAAADGANGTDPGQNRLFVGCVPFQFSEDDLKGYFEPVSFSCQTTLIVFPLLLMYHSSGHLPAFLMLTFQDSLSIALLRS